MAKLKKKKPTSKKCSMKGCRLVRRGGTEFCRKHQNGQLHEVPLAVAPDEKVIRLDNMDVLKFGKLDAELRNAAQGQKIADYQMSELQSVHKQRMKELQSNKDHLGRLIESRKVEYMNLVEGIAKKYGIGDPTKMTIDPDNGIVRDLRKQ